MGKYDHLAVISAARQNPAASSRQACPPFSSNVGRAKGYHGTVILSPRADNAFGIFGTAAMSSLENVLENSVNNVQSPLYTFRGFIPETSHFVQKNVNH